MEIRHFLKQYWIPLALLISGPMFGTAFSFWYFEIKSGQNTAIGLYLPSAFAFLTSILSIQIALSEIEKKVISSIYDTSENFKTYVREQQKGLSRIKRLTGESIDATINSRLSNATICRNTLVNIAKDIPYSHEASTIIQIKNFIKGDKRRWMDVTTFRDMQFGRYDRLKSAEIGSGTRYEVAIVDSSSLIPNFLILEDDERATDLFFGWIPDEDGRIEVFWTQEQHILGLFQQYYRHLFRSHIELIESESKHELLIKSRLENFYGTWLCIARERTITSVSKLNRYSLIKIEMGADGAWRLDIDVVEVASEIAIKIVKSEVVNIHKDRLFYEGTYYDLSDEKTAPTFGYFRPSDEYKDFLVGRYLSEDGESMVGNIAMRLSKSAKEEISDCISTKLEELINKKIRKIK